jgi:hypothetical protein
MNKRLEKIAIVKKLNQQGQERKMKRHAKNLGISPSVPQYAHVPNNQHGELAPDYAAFAQATVLNL